MKLSKKAISLISIGSAALIAGGTITAGLLIKSSNNDDKELNPLNRDKSYHHYSLNNKLKTNTKLLDLITLQKTGNTFIYVIDETKFINNIKSIIQQTLQQISAFSANWNDYKLEVSYKVKDATTISIDIVWYLIGSKVKYYDQFELILETN